MSCALDIYRKINYPTVVCTQVGRFKGAGKFSGLRIDLSHARRPIRHRHTAKVDQYKHTTRTVFTRNF